MADIMIVAAEASSSLYAQRLLEHWKSTGKKVEAFGVGSQEMVDLGFQAIGRSEEMAIMGLAEVVAHYPMIRRVFNQLIQECQKRKPKVILLMDYPDFNLRLAKKLKSLGIPIVYYISPQVWAWRTSRVHLIKKVVDKMLVILPFEKDFYKSHGVDVDFVGHPLLDEIARGRMSKEERKQIRSKYGISENDTLIGLMPGSRRSELKYLLQHQLDFADSLHAERPHLKFAMLVAPSFQLDDFKKNCPPFSAPIIFIKDDPFRMVDLTDYVLVASGTATLVVGLLQKPMVIIYKMNALTAWLAVRIVKGVQHFGLVNLIFNDRIFPEIFQENLTVENMKKEMCRYLDDDNYRREIQKKLNSLPELLGNREATIRVATALENYLQ